MSYLDILPNPTVDMVNAATKVYKESGATSIVALGGGSPMDVAKAVGVLARYGGSWTLRKNLQLYQRRKRAGERF